MKGKFHWMFSENIVRADSENVHATSPPPSQILVFREKIKCSTWTLSTSISSQCVHR